MRARPGPREEDAGLFPALTPRGHLILQDLGGDSGLEPAVATRLVEAFNRGSGPGLLQLGAGEVATTLPPVLAYWRDFGVRYVTARCATPDAAAGSLGDAGRLPTRPEHGTPAVALPDDETLAQVVDAVPPMDGAEYLTADVLRGLWLAVGAAFDEHRARMKASVQDALRVFSDAWHTVGRVHFHLAEHRMDPDAPFAFLATYTHGLSAHATPQHLPLGQALREYAGAAKRDRMLSLLLPVQRAAEQCPWLKAMVDAGEIFHALRWTPREAMSLLRDVPALERAGVVVRLPANWARGRPPRPKVTGTVGTKAVSGLGLDTLLDFQMGVTLDGETLTAEEIEQLLAGVDGLALVRGRWVEVNREQLRRMIDEFGHIERTAKTTGLSFAEAMRLMARTGPEVPDELGAEVPWAGVEAGPWLAHTLDGLRRPEMLAEVDPGADLRGTLRPYQQTGVRWLHFLSSLRLGACLADDMGLGKTIQVLSLLLVLKRQAKRERAAVRPSLLVAPASLLANWASEIARFAPSLSALIAHPSVVPAPELKKLDDDRVRQTDIVITSYGAVRTLPWLAAHDWDLVVVDEAQAIKNPGAKQTRAVKALRSRVRIALTGTPIENRLGDLWSIFDFINPGLLGSAQQFTTLTKRLANRPHNAYGPLRDLVRPYILRRLKTDRHVIADLPEKTEVNAYCLLSRRQAALYQQTVDDLAAELREADGMKRRGLVLASLMRLKQICNHPSQWLGDGAWQPADSGKWARLRDVAEVIAARQEKVLVFTQFREVTEPLAGYLGGVFGRPGLILHGGTPVRSRRDLVMRFQEDERVPFFVLSLKAGGSGLNLTAASHVIHFDRWWNPAVEDQATDRAFRIGQTRNVLVHKFVCRGTVEERIDEMIASKRSLARDVLEGGADLLLTEMSNEELLRLVALDIGAAREEE